MGLVMEYIGVDGHAAPRLKDTEGLSCDDWADLYRQCVLLMRRMMQECKLVHGDLSEYNMLYHRGEIVIIDVSQSVENDHPQSLEFLKRDCVNVNNFFAKMMACAAVPVKRLFDFIVTRSLPTIDGKSFAAGEDDEALDALLESVAEGLECADDAED